MTKKITMMGVLFGLAGVFSFVEGTSIGIALNAWCFFMAWAMFLAGCATLASFIGDEV